MKYLIEEHSKKIIGFETSDIRVNGLHDSICVSNFIKKPPGTLYGYLINNHNWWKKIENTSKFRKIREFTNEICVIFSLPDEIRYPPDNLLEHKLSKRFRLHDGKNTEIAPEWVSVDGVYVRSEKFNTLLTWEEWSNYLIRITNTKIKKEEIE